MTHSGAPRATAQGTLAKTPFAHVMQFAMGRELTGTLAVWPEGSGTSGPGQDRVYFETGVPVAMRSLQPAPNLAAGLLQLFARTQAPYAFYEGQDLLGRSMGVLRDSLDPFTVLSVGVRQHATENHVEPVLRQLGAQPLRLRVGLDLKRLDLEPDEAAVVNGLRLRPMTVLEAAEGHDPTLAHRVIYLLTLVKGLETLDPAKQPPRPPPKAPGEFTGRASQPGGDPYRSPPSARTSGVPSHSGARPQPQNRAAAPATVPEGGQPLPPKPEGLSSEDSAQWDELAARYPKLDGLNHFELLGVTTQATSSDITSAYFALVKRWHPERVSDGLAPLDAQLRLYFERLTEAHEVLASQEKRIEYLKSVQAGGGTRKADRMMADVVDAAMTMQKAEVLLRRRAFREALELVEEAIAKSPGEADNYAMRGWLRLLTAPAESAPLNEILQDIDHTLAGNKDHAKAHYYRAVVLKRRGDVQAALRHFEKASQLDPRNIEAQREVRLARIRKQSMNPPKKGGLWGKLFKG